MDLAQGWLLASSIYTEDKFRPIETAVAPMTLFLLGEMVKSMTPAMAQFARLRLPGKPGYTFIIMAVSRSTEQGPELNESPGCFIHAGGPLPFLSASRLALQTGQAPGNNCRFICLQISFSRAAGSQSPLAFLLTACTSSSE